MSSVSFYRSTSLRTSLWLGAAVLLFLKIGATPALAAAPSVPVAVGVDQGITRLVFNWPKITGYQATLIGDKIKIIFANPGPFDLSRITPGVTPLIDGVESVTSEDEMSEVTIDLADKATFKHFRLDRKVVIDISIPAAPPPAPVKEAEKPAPTPPPEKKEVEVAKAEAAPATKKEEVKPPAPLKEEPAPPEPAVKKEEPQKPAEVPASAVAPVEATPPVDADTFMPAPVNSKQEDISPPVPDTVISLSTLNQSALAVFRRSNTLWLVLNTDVSAVPPQLAGPMAGFLGQPKRVSFEGGTAFGFVNPPNTYLTITKENLSWQVIVSRANKALVTNAYITPDFVKDKKMTKASFIARVQGAAAPLEFEDPVIGDNLIVIPVTQPNSKMGQGLRIPDLEILPAALGMVIRKINDQVTAKEENHMLVISAEHGLSLTEGASALPSVPEAKGVEKDERPPRLFDFPNWRQGGLEMLDLNRRFLEHELTRATGAEEMSEIYLKLSLLYFSNNFPQEALGILRLALAENPKLENNISVIALRGAAQALAGQYEGAIVDLDAPLLQNQPEAGMWKGFAAAATEQWRLADQSFPKRTDLLLDYPETIAVPFTIYMAESALRTGDVERAKTLLGTINSFSKELSYRYHSAVEYLKGEAARQEKKPTLAIELWNPVIKGRDQLYHSKAMLSATKLLLTEKKISLKQAIDHLDGLRFAWRGDGLEVQIIESLGKLKIQNGQYLDGLKDLRQAVVLAEGDLQDSEPIRAFMAETFKDLFVNQKASTLPRLEAVAIYSDFSELAPSGTDGDIAAMTFAEYLVEMDLLSRAEDIIEQQIARQPEGSVARARMGARLATIYLLDDKPSEAISTLDGSTAGDVPPELKEQRDLLRARSWSQKGEPDNAIAALAGLTSKDALYLIADIYWRVHRWDKAAEAISRFLPPVSGKAFTKGQAETVLNAAIAYKLSGNADKLLEMKRIYSFSMQNTDLAQTFGVVTREPGKTTLADKDSMLKIASEVDMFKGSLQAYKTSLKSDTSAAP